MNHRLSLLGSLVIFPSVGSCHSLRTLLWEDNNGRISTLRYSRHQLVQLLIECLFLTNWCKVQWEPTNPSFVSETSEGSKEMIMYICLMNCVAERSWDGGFLRQWWLSWNRRGEKRHKRRAQMLRSVWGNYCEMSLMPQLQLVGSTAHSSVRLRGGVRYVIRFV